MIYNVPQRLLNCITEMGNQHTNAVLLTLNGVDSIKPYQRYPAQPYYFGDQLWRAFYHCHDSNNMDNREHGHFHFFTRINNDEEWSHVIAMGMDKMGLPISLFTTNLWVTDGDWFDTQLLKQQLHVLQNSDDDDLPLSWFKYMLLLYQDKIQELLHERDVELRRLCPASREHCFIDRTIYYLSHSDIDLNEQLSCALNGVQSVANTHEEELHHDQ